MEKLAGALKTEKLRNAPNEDGTDRSRRPLKFSQCLFQGSNIGLEITALIRCCANKAVLYLARNPASAPACG